MLTEIVTPGAGANGAGRDYTNEEAAAMLRAVLNLFAKWELTDAQAARLLGGVTTRSLQRWRGGDAPKLSLDMADRMSYLLGIHKALRLIFKDAERVYGWVKRPNKEFGDQSALDVMLKGHMSDLARVRLYLDSARGGW